MKEISSSGSRRTFLHLFLSYVRHDIIHGVCNGVALLSLWARGTQKNITAHESVRHRPSDRYLAESGKQKQIRAYNQFSSVPFIVLRGEI